VLLKIVFLIAGMLSLGSIAASAAKDSPSICKDVLVGLHFPEYLSDPEYLGEDGAKAAQYIAEGPSKGNAIPASFRAQTYANLREFQERAKAVVAEKSAAYGAALKIIRDPAYETLKEEIQQLRTRMTSMPIKDAMRRILYAEEQILKGDVLFRELGIDPNQPEPKNIVALMAKKNWTRDDFLHIRVAWGMNKSAIENAKKESSYDETSAVEYRSLQSQVDKLMERLAPLEVLNRDATITWAQIQSWVASARLYVLATQANPVEGQTVSEYFHAVWEKAGKPKGNHRGGPFAELILELRANDSETYFLLLAELQILSRTP
jgi:hypothetical protein